MGQLESLLRLMRSKNASDLYLSVQAPATLKIKGTMLPVNSRVLAADAVKSLLSEMLSTAQLELLEQGREVSCSFDQGDAGHFRVSAFRQRGSCAAVIRCIPSEIPALNTLGLPPVLAELAMERSGLLLICGAAGSGKSTTAVSMVDHRNTHSKSHILTLESPIEFLIKNKQSIVNQREIGTDSLSLRDALEGSLHQAVDLLLIGEIRDQQTAMAALTHAQMGNLCVATLHAKNVRHALTRIAGFFPLEARSAVLGDLSIAVRAIVAQRLLRSTAGTVVVAAEVLLNNPLIAELIEKGDFVSIGESLEKGVASGSQSMDEAIAYLVRKGTVEQPEGLSLADSPINLTWRLQNDFAQARTSSASGNGREDEPEFTHLSMDVRFE